MMRKTPQKADRGRDVGDGCQYHKMTSHNDGFVDMQVLATQHFSWSITDISF